MLPKANIPGIKRSLHIFPYEIEEKASNGNVYRKDHGSVHSARFILLNLLQLVSMIRRLLQRLWMMRT
jgi:hypothetical protein